MWIFTNGLDSGITKIIGEAVNIKLKEQSFARDLRKAFPTTSDSLNFIGVVRDDRLKTRHALKNDYVINDVSGLFNDFKRLTKVYTFFLQTGR